MKGISQATVLVYDHGLFQSVAHRLAEKFKRVLYHVPWQKAFPTLNECCVGDGFSDIELCSDFWPIKDEIDCFVFPDLYHAGLQLELESQGIPVFGSREGDSLEINRRKFNRVLREVGLPVAKHDVITGLTNLRLFLRDKTDRYIKISKYRGTMETTHWRDYGHDQTWLDAMAHKLGPLQDKMIFLVFEPIDAPVEVGGDAYCIDGKWPSLMFHADEEKDKAYIGAVTKREEMPKEIQDIMEAFSPVLEKERYRNQWSFETRDGRFIDATCRAGLPSTTSQLNTWKNYAEIVWYGAHGKMVEPIPSAQFSVECILNLKGKKDEWGKVKIWPEMDRRIQFASCCESDGFICWPPDDDDDNDVGWMQANGDTIEEAIEEIHKMEETLPDGLSTCSDALIGLLAKIRKGEKAGIEFSDKEVPAPETALQVEGA